MASLTIENYVKAIYLICARGDRSSAATGMLAESLGVSPGTVTSMLKTLNESGLAEYKPYEGVSLTEAGQRLALRIIRRHRLIELFLARTLRMPWDEVHEEAEHMEHAVSDRLIDRIDAFLEFPASDPHGDPIPSADGVMPAVDAARLSDWEVSRPFQISRVVDQSPDFLRYLSDAGLEIGTTAVVAARQTAAGILTLHHAGRDVALAQAAAARILVGEPPPSRENAAS